MQGNGHDVRKIDTRSGLRYGIVCSINKALLDVQ